MLEWNVAEDGEGALVEQEERAVPLWQRWWPWLVLWMVLFGLFGGMVWWRVREQERALRTVLQATVDAETRLMANGVPDEALAFAETVADPDVPDTWLYRYWYQFVGARTFQEMPTVGQVTLENNGEVARVDVQWTLPEGTPGTREATEQRAYRLVNGEWRRTRLPTEEVEREERRTKAFVLRATPDDLAVLEAMDLEGLRAHLRETWPSAWLTDETIYLTVQPSELGFVVNQPTNMQSVLLNSRVFSVPQLTLDLPLSADAQYRLQVTSEVVRRLTFPSQANPAWERPFSVSSVLTALKEAETRHWTLSEAERRALRNRWRAELAGQWSSPLEGAFYRSVVNTPRQREQAEQRQLALALALEFLVEREGVDVLGQMAGQLAATEAEFAALATEVTGASTGALELAMRAYATEMEE